MEERNAKSYVTLLSINFNISETFCITSVDKNAR